MRQLIIFGEFFARSHGTFLVLLRVGESLWYHSVHTTHLIEQLSVLARGWGSKEKVRIYRADTQLNNDQDFSYHWISLGVIKLSKVFVPMCHIRTKLWECRFWWQQPKKQNNDLKRQENDLKMQKNDCIMQKKYRKYNFCHWVDWRFCIIISIVSPAYPVQKCLHSESQNFQSPMLYGYVFKSLVLLVGFRQSQVLYSENKLLVNKIYVITQE